MSNDTEVGDAGAKDWLDDRTYEIGNAQTPTEAAIRADERLRMAGLFEQHKEVIADFAADKERLVGLIALMLRLGELSPSVADKPETPA